MEIWKDVVGYEGLYKVSNLGRVKSLARKAVDRTVNERILKYCNKAHGYSRLTLRKDFIDKTFNIQHLVYEAFVGRREKGMVIDHINNIRSDNRLENLQQITYRENTSKDIKKKKRTSKYIGVSFSIEKKKWVSHIQLNGVSKYLGYFENELDASRAYQSRLAKPKETI